MVLVLVVRRRPEPGRLASPPPGTAAEAVVQEVGAILVGRLPERMVGLAAWQPAAQVALAEALGSSGKW